MSLNFGQHNSLASALRELLIQIEELSRLIQSPQDSLLPITETISESEQRRIVPVLKNLRNAIMKAVEDSHIEIAPIEIQHKLRGSVAYMKSVILSMSPKHLHGYGNLSDEDAETIQRSIVDIISLLDKIS
jgi:hypothetical protein